MIQIDRLSKHFGGLLAVDNVSLNVGSGSITGSTTLLECMSSVSCHL